MPIQIAEGTSQIGYLAPPNTAGKTSAITASTTVQQFPVPPNQPLRRTLMIQNNGSVGVYVGFTGAVSSSTGVLIAAGTSLIFDVGDQIDTYIVAASSTAACIALELS